MEIRSFFNHDDEVTCAREISGSEPWITLGLTYGKALEISSDTSLERYTIIDGSDHAGFLLLNMGAQFPGYIKILCTAASCRGRGIGEKLIRFAEDRIFSEYPNIFLCVSSFNTGARRFYERMGFHEVGELTNYIIDGNSEILMRKTIGPRKEFKGREFA
jgi:[ribosomal protein S18]-alanine N-acetyltransferase